MRPKATREHSGAFRRGLCFDTSRNSFLRRGQRTVGAKWVRFAHSRASGAKRCILVHFGAFGFVLRIRESCCTTSHGVAPGCMGLHEPSFSDALFRVCGFADRRVLVREAASGKARAIRAPSPTPQSCAIVTTIAHDRADFPRKTNQKIPDSRNSFCALLHPPAPRTPNEEGATPPGAPSSGIYVDIVCGPRPKRPSTCSAPARARCPS
jgi:hypothetical protein